MPVYAKPDKRLENLALDVKTLPPACKATDPRKDPTNAELTKQHPAVSTDPKFIQDMSMLLFGESFNYGSIDKATFLTYLGDGIERNEIGIFAWLFKTDEAAEKARQALSYEHSKMASGTTGMPSLPHTDEIKRHLLISLGIRRYH